MNVKLLTETKKRLDNLSKALPLMMESFISVVKDHCFLLAKTSQSVTGQSLKNPEAY